MEVWKTPASCPNIEVSNLGNVRKKDSGDLLRIYTYAYRFIYLGHGESKKVANLVVEAFLPIPTKYMIKPKGYNSGRRILFANHIDGNKHNDSLTNLEWVNTRDNVRHALITGLRKSNKL